LPLLQVDRFPARIGLATHTPPVQVRKPLLLAMMPSGEQAAPTTAHWACAPDAANVATRNKAAATPIFAILAFIVNLRIKPRFPINSPASSTKALTPF